MKEKLYRISHFLIEKNKYCILSVYQVKIFVGHEWKFSQKLHRVEKYLLQTVFETKKLTRAFSAFPNIGKYYISG